MAAQIARITIFPLKSFDGLSASETVVMPSGALQYDRQFALIDSNGRFINAKRTPLVHQLSLTINPETREFQVARHHGEIEIRGHLDEDGRELSDWLSHYFSEEISIVENDEVGFPDDLVSPGPTIVSTATLETVADWFAPIGVEEVRRRFRANIEVGGVEPFWEDRLFRKGRLPQPFRIGDVLFAGINPCQRCVVPTRDSQTGDATPPSFAKQFADRRKETLPDWVATEYFDHFYRLSTNTRLLELGPGVIRVGDAIEIE